MKRRTKLQKILASIIEDKANKLMSNDHKRYKRDCGFNEYGSIGEAWEVEQAQEDAKEEIIDELYDDDISAFNTDAFRDFLIKEIQK